MVLLRMDSQTGSMDRARLDSLLRKSKKCGFNATEDDFNSECTTADNRFFTTIISDTHHVLYPLLPPKVIQTQSFPAISSIMLPRKSTKLFSAIFSLVYYTPTRRSNNIIGCVPINTN